VHAVPRTDAKPIDWQSRPGEALPQAALRVEHKIHDLLVGLLHYTPARLVVTRSESSNPDKESSGLSSLDPADRRDARKRGQSTSIWVQYGGKFEILRAFQLYNSTAHLYS
jgi:hypothetical protein